MWIIYTREIEQFFYQWAYCAFYVCFELKDWKSAVLFRFKPFTDLSTFTRCLNNFRLFVIGSNIKCYACAQDLSPQLHINWSKIKFNLIFLWHSGWSLRMTICSSKKLNYAVFLYKNVSSHMSSIWWTCTMIKLYFFLLLVG